MTKQRTRRLSARLLEGESLQPWFIEQRAEIDGTIAPYRGAYGTALQEARACEQALETAGAPQLGELGQAFDAILTAARVQERALCDAGMEAGRRRRACVLELGVTEHAPEPRRGENALILGVCGACEALVSAGFFLSAHLAGGPLQAMQMAALIAGTNVAVSLAGGWFIGRRLGYGRYADDPDAPEYAGTRRTAQFALYGFLGAMGIFHLEVALMRAQERVRDIEHSLTAYGDILASPEAVFLVMIQVVMSALSWSKGVSGFARGPHGYAEALEASEAVQARWESLCEEICAEIEDRHAALAADIDDAEIRLQEPARAYIQAAERVRTARRDLEREIDLGRDALIARIAPALSRAKALLLDPEAGAPQSFIDKLTEFAVPPPAETFKPAVLPTCAAERAALGTARSKALADVTALFGEKGAISALGRQPGGRQSNSTQRGS